MNRHARRQITQLAEKLSDSITNLGVTPRTYPIEDMLAGARLSATLCDEAGRLRVLPTSTLARIPPQHLRAAGHLLGVYLFPSTELVEWIRKNIIRGRSCIEIGAGRGALGLALGIPCTDSYMREGTEEPIPYGEHVERLNAEEAVEKYKPQVVIASWLIHRFAKGAATGSAYGPRFRKLIRAPVQEYMMVGNSYIHRHMDGMQDEFHVVRERPRGIFSRATFPDLDMVYRWRRER